MEWKNIKDCPLDPDKDEGTYLILVNYKIHIAYFSFVNWNRSWHIAQEWNDPTHYIKIPDCDNVFIGKRNVITMD